MVHVPTPVRKDYDDEDEDDEHSAYSNPPLRGRVFTFLPPILFFDPFFDPFLTFFNLASLNTGRGAMNKKEGRCKH